MINGIIDLKAASPEEIADSASFNQKSENTSAYSGGTTLESGEGSPIKESFDKVVERMLSEEDAPLNDNSEIGENISDITGVEEKSAVEEDDSSETGEETLEEDATEDSEPEEGGSEESTEGDGEDSSVEDESAEGSENDITEEQHQGGELAAADLGAEPPENNNGNQDTARNDAPEGVVKEPAEVPAETRQEAAVIDGATAKPAEAESSEQQSSGQSKEEIELKESAEANHLEEKPLQENALTDRGSGSEEQAKPQENTPVHGTAGSPKDAIRHDENEAAARTEEKAAEEVPAEKQAVTAQNENIETGKTLADAVKADANIQETLQTAEVSADKIKHETAWTRKTAGEVKPSSLSDEVELSAPAGMESLSAEGGGDAFGNQADDRQFDDLMLHVEKIRKNLTPRQAIEAAAGVRQMVSSEPDAPLQPNSISSAGTFENIMVRMERLQEVVERFDEHFLSIISGKSRSMTIALDPPSLGKLTLNCREQSGELVVEIIADSKFARGFLSNQEENIRDMVYNSGYRLGQFNVRSEAGNAGQKQWENEAGQHGSGSGEDSAEETPAEDVSGEEWLYNRDGSFMLVA